MSETDAEFLKRIEYDWFDDWSPNDKDRLLALATRGAAVPDEPTEAMVRAGAAEHHTRMKDNKYATLSTNVYRAMLATALKDTTIKTEAP